MHPPCGHAYALPPVDGCAYCRLRDHPFHKARWTAQPLDPTPDVRVRWCEARQVWDWSVTSAGRTVASGSEPTEAEARAEAEAVASTIPDTFTPGKRHLLYHILPVMGNGVWQCNLDWLKCRLPLFDGRRVIAICTYTKDTPHALDPPAAVREYLRGCDCDFLELPNNPTLREVVTWGALWDQLADLSDSDDVAFYGHAKGVTRPVNPGVTVHTWARIAYAANLDYWPVVRDLLGRHPIAGAFKKVGYGFQGSKSRWHYSGSFFWIRLREAFFANRVGIIDRRWWGNEAWPGLHFAPDQAAGIFRDGTVPALDLYSPDVLFCDVVPDFIRWGKANRGRLTHV